MKKKDKINKFLYPPPFFFLSEEQIKKIALPVRNLIKVKDALKNLQLNDPEKGIIQINKLPESYFKYYLLGVTYLLKGDNEELYEKGFEDSFKSALKSFEIAEKKAEFSAPLEDKLMIRIFLAIANAGIGILSEVNLDSTFFEEELSKMPDSKGKKEIREVFNSATQWCNGRFYRYKAETSHKNREFSKAAEYIRLSIKYYQFDADSHFDLGLIYFDTNRYSEAIDAFLQTIRIAKTKIKPYFWIGLSYVLINHIEKGVSYIRDFLNVSESRGVKNELVEQGEVIYFFYKGMLKWEKGLIDEANKDFSKIINTIGENIVKGATHFIVLYNTIVICKELKELDDVNNLSVLLNKLEIIFNKQMNIYDKCTKDAETLSDLEKVRAYIMFVLIRNINSHAEANLKTLIKTRDINLWDNIRDEVLNFSSASAICKQINFIDCVYGINGIKKFVKEVKGLKINELTEGNERNLIKELTNYLRLLFKPQTQFLPNTIFVTETRGTQQKIMQKREKIKLEIGIDSLSKPYIKMCNRSETISDYIFVLLVLLAAVKVSGNNEGFITKELKGLDLPRGDQSLSAVKKFLSSKINSCCNMSVEPEQAVEILRGTKQIRLALFEKEAIEIKNSVCSFQWTKFDYFKNNIEKISEWRSKTKPSKFTSLGLKRMVEQQFGNVKNFLQVGNSFFRYHRLVEKACKILGKKFHDKQFRNSIEKLENNFRYCEEKIVKYKNKQP